MGNNKQLVFQIVLIAVFSVVAAVGVFVLARGGGFGKSVVPITEVTIWGPRFTGESVQSLLSDMKDIDPRFEKVTYVEKHPLTLYSDTLEAIATGKAPDMVIVDQATLLPLKNKLVAIPYEQYPVSDFRRDFVEIAEIFLQDEGVYALPFAVDPLVLFWNRDLFTNSTIAQVPENWDIFVRLAPRLSVIADGADLRQGAIAFGEYENVMHAKEILSALLFQLDNPIVERVNKKYKSTLLASEGGGARSPEKALAFYTDFANPNKLVYSWNKKFAPSREAFSTNKVAMYAGFASEVPTLTQINPNLNFGLTLWPQSTVGTQQVTYGKVYGVALLASSPKKDRAISVMRALSERVSAEFWKNATLLPSVRRDMLTETPSDDPYAGTLVRSAIMARTWLEPAGGGRGVDEVFESMVNTVVGNKEPPGSAISEAHRDLEALYAEYNE